MKYAIYLIILHRENNYDLKLKHSFRSRIISETNTEKIVKVDRKRINFIRSLFKKLEFKGAEFETRTRLFLYYLVAEPTIFYKNIMNKY
jgi:hypothetical protein